MPLIFLGALVLGGFAWLVTRPPVVVVQRPTELPPTTRRQPVTEVSIPSARRPNRPEMPRHQARTPQPLPPPGLTQGQRAASRETESLHDTLNAPSAAPEELQSRATITSSPIESQESHAPAFTVSPAVPLPSRSRANQQQLSIRGSANPEQVLQSANQAAMDIRLGNARAPESIREFQRDYGRGLGVDGVYGRNTRTALAHVLGVAPETLPPLPHR